MKLYTCKYCDVEVKFRDVKCPWCGRKMLFNGKRFTSTAWVIFICIWMLILTSCIKTGDAYDKSINDSDTIIYSNNGVITNTERLDKFIQNVADMKKDRININRFTDEGDPIITQLYFNKTKIEIFIDRSKDKFGGKDKDKIIHETINNSEVLIEALNKYLEDNLLTK